MTAMVPRIVNFLLGLWLIVSAFIWPHMAAQKANAIASGMLAAIFAGSGLLDRQVRYLNLIIGAWLVSSGIYLMHFRSATMWNEVVTGIALSAVALLPGRQRKNAV
ncbi:MAG TPA: hypothetical protein VH374_10160 [Polyangia bacterium]|nr:hypothetical protein [Polyangia bacterium]